MPVELNKSAIDLGIVAKNADAMVDFYRDVLGFDYEGTADLPGGIHMHRLWCGDSLIKILALEKAPAGEAPPGGITGGTGYRYWTITVSNLEAITEQCADAGRTVVVPVTEIRPGVRVSIVEDPDGNWVEFLEG